ncbi:MAG: LamB/YcsF family protein [Propionibacteriaceae bacterium]
MDLNADLGESYGRWTLGDDDAMLAVITSANVACGFHAGDPTTLRRTCAAAVDHDVRIGAQVGYPDLAGFGRRFLDVDPVDLTADVIYQLGALDGLARSEGGRVSYLKPHGALYNAIVDHEAQAQAVVDAVLAYDPRLAVLGLPGSVFLERAERAGLTAVTEYFVDRAYTPDGRLVDRREPGAVLIDVEVAADRAVVAAQDNRARSFCTHGDSLHAVAMALRVRGALLEAGIDISPFC